MQTVHLLGHVFPSILHVTLKDLPEADWIWQERNQKLHFSISITNSKIDVKCDLDNFESGDLVELHRRSFDLVRAAVDLVSFSKGIGLTVVLESIY